MKTRNIVMVLKDGQNFPTIYTDVLVTYENYDIVVFCYVIDNSPRVQTVFRNEIAQMVIN